MGRRKKRTKIHEFARESGMLMRDIAKQAGITPAGLWGITRGHTQDIHLSTAIRLKSVTGLNPHEYLTIPGCKYKINIEILQHPCPPESESLTELSKSEATQELLGKAKKARQTPQQDLLDL